MQDRGSRVRGAERVVVPRGVRCRAWIGEFAVSAPSIVLSAWLFIGTAARLGRWAAIAVAVGWALSGVAVWMMAGFAAATMSTMKPEAEADLRETLDAAWHRIAAAAGVDPAAYTVWIKDAEQINGFSGVGGYLAVTREAVETLTEDQLAALLAHELGHQLMSTVRWRLLMRWYRWPVEAVGDAVLTVITALPSRVQPALTRAAHRLNRAGGFLPFSPLGLVLLVGLPVLSLLVWAAVIFVGLVLLLGLPGAYIGAAFFLTQPFTRTALSRWTEGRADRIVADLGYGSAFQDLLRIMYERAEELEPAAAPGFLRVFDSHPPMQRRIDRLRRRDRKG